MVPSDRATLLPVWLASEQVEGLYNNIGYPFHMDEVMVFSLTSFHGRGFFPGGLGLDDPITKIATGESVVG